MTVDESPPCQTCTFWDGKKCLHTWRLMVHITPMGGQMDFSTTPGMIPEHLMPVVDKFFKDFIDKLAPAIEKFPIWGEIREWQLANLPETERCPGRQTIKGSPYLYVVRGDLDLSFESKEKG